MSDGGSAEDHKKKKKLYGALDGSPGPANASNGLSDNDGQL